MSVTMAEIDRLRATADHHVELRRVYTADVAEAEMRMLCAARCEGYSDTYRAEAAGAYRVAWQRLSRATHDAGHAEAAVLVALTQWWAQGSREVPA